MYTLNDSTYIKFKNWKNKFVESEVNEIVTLGGLVPGLGYKGSFWGAGIIIFSGLDSVHLTKIIHNLRLEFLHILCVFVLQLKYLRKTLSWFHFLCLLDFHAFGPTYRRTLKKRYSLQCLFSNLLNRFPMLNSLTSFKSLLRCHLLSDISLTTLFSDAGLFPLHPDLIFFFLFLQSTYFPLTH